MGKKSRNKQLTAREQIALQHSKQSKKTGIGKKIGVTAGIVIVIGVIVALIIGGSKNNDVDYSAVNQPSVTKGNGIIIAKGEKVVPEAPDDVSKLIIYQDYMCPGCGQFESEYAPELDKILEEGVGSIEYRTVGMLDQMSAGTNYSSRSANVALCAAVEDPNKFYQLNKLFYTNQPEEGSAGLRNAELTDLAESLGIEGIDKCVSDGTYRGFVKEATDTAIEKDNIAGTPTVMLNGKKFELGNSIYDAMVEANKKL